MPQPASAPVHRMPRAPVPLLNQGSCLPEQQWTLLGIGSQQVSVRVVCDTDGLLLVHRHDVLQLAAAHVEAVEHVVLTQGIHPLATR